MREDTSMEYADRTDRDEPGGEERFRSERLTLERFHPVKQYVTELDDFHRLRGVYVDCETTGLDPKEDSIIQLSLVPFTFTRDGIVCSTGEAYTAYEDPTTPITPEITRINGITDEMVAGKKFDDAWVEELFQNTAIVVAHNAEFDRQFMENRFGAVRDLRWGCSKVDVPWRDAGYTCDKLEWLLFKHLGMFFDAHRADTDAYVGIHLLASELLPSSRTAMSYVLDAARQTYVRVWAMDSPYSTKGILKKRGYTWNNGDDGRPKAWYRDVIAGEPAMDEQAWLTAEVYGHEGFGGHPVVQRFDAKQRFSGRIGR